MFNQVYTDLSMAIENNILLHSISQFAYDKSVIWEYINDQYEYIDYTKVHVEQSNKWLANSWLLHDNKQVDWINNLIIYSPTYHYITNVELYGVNEENWLAVQSNSLSDSYLGILCPENSVMGQVFCNIKNSKINSDMQTNMSHICISSYQKEYYMACNAELPGGGPCSPQYGFGQNTNNNICCTQQSAHNCQVSNSSLDVQRGVPSWSGSLLRSSVNLGKSYKLRTVGYGSLIQGNDVNICYQIPSYNIQKRGNHIEKDCLTGVNDNIILTNKNLATCLSHDSQYVYSKQDSFSDKNSFNYYSYVSQFENFSYRYDIMNKTNMFASDIINETSWCLDDSRTLQKVTSVDTKTLIVNTIHDSSVVEGNDMHVMVHRSYGFIPLAMSEYQCTTEGKNLEFEPTQQWLENIHKQVKVYGVPNYKGACIRVPSTLNVKAWRQLVEHYDYKILAEYIEFGFPMNIDYNTFVPNTHIVNHKSAICRPEGVNKYFQIETSKQAMLGPFDKQPFDAMHFSPLMARDKPDGGVRVIVDLSWPLGQSVNSCVTPNYFDNVEFKLKYPTVDLLVEKINEIGPSALLYKIDLERAFRNLRIDPFDYPVLGLKWKNSIFVDLGLPFGFATGAASCQSCTDLVTWTLSQKKIWIMNYLDDFWGVSPPPTRLLVIFYH